QEAEILQQQQEANRLQQQQSPPNDLSSEKDVVDYTWLYDLLKAVHPKIVSFVLDVLEKISSGLF
ncbi:MAG: hypothetical protein V7K47_31755, partial [Nostoc sp.]